MQFWIRSGTSVVGPFDALKIRELVASGQLKPDMEISKDGVAWHNAGQVKGLFPPPKPAEIDDFSAESPLPAAPAPVPHGNVAVPPAYVRPTANVPPPLPSAPIASGDAVDAGIWWRMAAYMIDIPVVWVLGFLLFLVPHTSFFLNFAAIFLYCTLMESSAWQATLGKLAMGIKVTDGSGQRINFGRAAGRFFGKILSGLILVIGFLFPLWTARKQALHDLLAKTLVVFRGVQPGVPAPVQRPPLPWYGWVANLSMPLLVLVSMLAGIVVPAYQDYVTRSQVAEGSVLADGAKTAVAEYASNNNGSCPSNNAAAGLGEPSETNGKYVESVSVTVGEQNSCLIVVKFRDAEPAATPIRETLLVFKSVNNAPDGFMRWTCRGNMAQKYLPSNCRE